MRIWQKYLLVMVMVSLIFSWSGGSASAKTYKLTVVAGHPPIFLWVTLCRDYFIPEVDKRLQAAGGKHKIVWNQAYGGTIAKIGGALEAIEEGIADMGFVGTIFEAPKMPLHNLTYMTPFGSDNIFYVVDVIAELQSKIPALAQEWTNHNQIYLSDAERKRWADKLPNVPMEWAQTMEKKGLPGKDMLKGYLDGLRARGVKLARHWVKDLK